MKKIYINLIISILFLFSAESKANTLFDSLNSAYLKNSNLNAERASMRATKEDKRESLSEFLPSVTLSGSIGEQENTISGNDTNLNPSEQSMTVEQKLFQGGSGIANFKKKKHGQTLGEYKLKFTVKSFLVSLFKASVISSL